MFKHPIKHRMLFSIFTGRSYTLRFLIGFTLIPSIMCITDIIGYLGSIRGPEYRITFLIFSRISFL